MESKQIFTFKYFFITKTLPLNTFSGCGISDVKKGYISKQSYLIFLNKVYRDILVSSQLICLKNGFVNYFEYTFFQKYKPNPAKTTVSMGPG